MKSSYYTATVVKAYREEIDRYYEDPSSYKFNPAQMDEISKASHREYTTGFYLSKPSGKDQVYKSSSYIREYDFVGLILDYDKKTGIAKVEQRNKMFEGDIVEIVNPKGGYFTQRICNMKDEEYNDIQTAPHPQMTVYMPVEREVERFSMIRRKV